MNLPKPSKPAGCFFQLVGGILLIVGIVRIATVDYAGIGSILLAGLGLILLIWGGVPARHKQ